MHYSGPFGPNCVCLSPAILPCADSPSIGLDASFGLEMAWRMGYSPFSRGTRQGLGCRPWGGNSTWGHVLHVEVSRPSLRGSKDSRGRSSLTCVHAHLFSPSIRKLRVFTLNGPKRTDFSSNFRKRVFRRIFSILSFSWFFSSFVTVVSRSMFL